MPGVRLHHREKRDCVVQIPHMGRTTPTGPKLYNLRLDANGDVIVSATVLQRLREAQALLGVNLFVILDEVKEPPSLLIGGSQGQVRRVFRFQDGALREQVPQREALHVARSRTG